MVFYIDYYEFAHPSRASLDRCLVYSRIGLIGRVIQDDIRMLWRVRGCYRFE